MHGCLLAETIGRFEYSQRLTDRPHIVHADNLHTLHGQRKCGANRCIRAIGFFVADEFAQEALARVAEEQRAAEVVEFVAVPHECDIVLVRFAEADARV